ncbi:MAG: response regulator, partial [Chlorobium sp.]
VSMHKSIFDRFQQVDKSLTRAHEGSGLGLCISEAFVNMLGGSIRVESAEGKGSTFIFTLPYTLEGSLKPEQLSPDLLEQTTATPPLTVLLAEDDEVSTMLLTKSLKNENINFLCAENGWVATELVERHPEINLVIMDLKMPIMNGFEATKLIKLDHPDLPIVVLSAFTSEEVRQKAKEAGCDGFITKPIGKEELVEITEFLVKR